MTRNKKIKISTPTVNVRIKYTHLQWENSTEEVCPFHEYWRRLKAILKVEINLTFSIGHKCFSRHYCTICHTCKAQSTFMPQLCATMMWLLRACTEVWHCGPANQVLGTVRNWKTGGRWKCLWPAGAPTAQDGMGLWQASLPYCVNMWCILAHYGGRHFIYIFLLWSHTPSNTL